MRLLTAQIAVRALGQKQLITAPAAGTFKPAEAGATAGN